MCASGERVCVWMKVFGLQLYIVSVFCISCQKVCTCEDYVHVDSQENMAKLATR